MDFSRCVGLDYRTMIAFDAAKGDPLVQKSLMQQELIKRGVLWNGFHNVSLSHDDGDIAHLLDAYREVLPILRSAVHEGRLRDYLRGEPVAPVFRRTTNFHTKKRADLPQPSRHPGKDEVDRE